MGLIDDVADYWDRRSAGFSDAVNDEIDNGLNQVRGKITSELGISKGTRVLDIGCGPGYFEMLLKDTGADLHAIDYSAGMVGQARSNMERLGIDADIRRMDAQHLQFEDCTFDAVISRNVLWSLTEPEQAYREIVRVMRPGARAYITDGNYYLHLYDEDYRRKVTRPRPREPEAGSHEKFNKGQVDFKEIEELAKGLPLSRERRPQWDFGVLCTLPCTDIRVSTRAITTDDGFRRIGAFDIYFEKEVQ